MDLSSVMCRGIASEARSVGLWGMTPDGPAECSFDGYYRSPLLDPQISGDRVSWGAASFGPVQALGGVAPSGWALFDSDGLMLHRETAVMGQMRRRVSWNLAPALKVEVQA